MTIQARTLIRVALPWAAFVLALALLAVLAGCAGLPLEGSDPPQLPYYVPGTDWQVFTAAPAGAPTPGQDWLALGLKIVGVLTGTSGLFSLASPNGRKVLATVVDPAAGTGASLKAAASALTFGYVPPPKET